MLAHRVAGEVRQRHEALAAALPANHEVTLAGRRRRSRECDQLGDAQARGVEQLEQAEHPLRSPRLSRCLGLHRRVDLHARHGKQPVDFGHREQLRAACGHASGR